MVQFFMNNYLASTQTSDQIALHSVQLPLLIAKS